MPRLTLSLPEELGPGNDGGGTTAQTARREREGREREGWESTDEPHIVRWFECLETGAD
ncbi:MAG: hypothetical protein ACI8XM_002664 [Haloarculaceae archaeon]|jgi:hypothetical protein